MPVTFEKSVRLRTIFNSKSQFYNKIIILLIVKNEFYGNFKNQQSYQDLSEWSKST